MEKEIDTIIIVIKDGKSYNITDTLLIKDYKSEKYIPEVDKLLDWRLHLMNTPRVLKSEREFIKKEIIAVDYLLNLKQKND